MKTTLLIFATLALVGCENTLSAQEKSQQIATGKQVFTDNCQTCHGVNARGAVKDWQKPNADGKYPAPPLNGTAHAWHHNMGVLRSTVDRGSIRTGGTMPPFEKALTDEQKTAVLAYIQSLWPKEIYNAWKQKNG